MIGLLSTLVFAAMAIFQTQATLPPGCDRNATVAAGDTCNAISAQYNVSTYQLALVNTGIINSACSNLYAGEVLCLGITGQDCNTTYVVQPNDACPTIAVQFNISLSTLETNNPSICSDLQYDEVLCVASMIIPYNQISTA